MTAPLRDPVLINDWHPVAIAAELAPGQQTATLLLDTHVLVWRSQDGRLHAWGTPEQVLTAQNLAEVFQVEAHIGLDATPPIVIPR